MSVDAVRILTAMMCRHRKTNTGYTDTVQTVSEYTLIEPTVANANRFYSTTYSIAASGTQTINLQSLTDALGQTITATKAYAIRIQNTGANISLKAGAADGFVWFLVDASDILLIHTGGTFAWASATATTVDATHKNLLITNLSGSDATSVKVELVLGQ